MEVSHETEDPRPLYEFLGWTLAKREHWRERPRLQPQRRKDRLRRFAHHNQEPDALTIAQYVLLVRRSPRYFGMESSRAN